MARHEYRAMATRVFRQGRNVHIVWAVEGGDTVRVVVSDDARQSFLHELKEPTDVAEGPSWTPWTVKGEKPFE